MSSPGIIMTGKFARPSSGAFQSYIEYMDRENAVRNEAYEQYSAFTASEGTSELYEGDSEETLDGYIKYMANPIKTSNLFTLETNSLDSYDISELKSAFIQASESGSPMWQDVFSFRNEWLVEHGYLDPITNQLDEKKIQNATRLGMNAMLKKEDMTHSAIWTASIHYNTDNIHVHIATVEPKSTRDMHTYTDPKTNMTITERKGYRSRATLRSMKSAFANQLIGLEAERTRIDELKKKMIEGMRSEIGKSTITQYGDLLQQIIEKLPPQKGYQKYGYAEKFDFKKPLDQMINIFLKENYSDLLNEIQERQERISFEEETAFGEGRTSSENKMKTLYTRLGNSILKHIKELDIHPKRNQHARFDATELEELQENFKDRNLGDQRIANEFVKQKRLKKKPQYTVADFEDALKLLMEHSKNDKGRPSDEDIDNFYRARKEKRWSQINHNDKGLEIPLKVDIEKETVELDQAFDKVVNNEKRFKKDGPPTQQMIKQYHESLIKKRSRQLPKESDSYQLLFLNESDYVSGTFSEIKDKTEKEFQSNKLNDFKRIKKSRTPKLSIKEMEARQRAWQDEMNRRKQISKLKRLLNDSTEQWRNEQKYQQMVNEIEYLAGDS
ncbi:MobP2 family relaxase [Enterococcus avium]|uniref:MobP2 family relaxase n=1 Tax=Enterococcus avium TaxID=33945 RepID=UPI00351739FB